MTKLDRFGERDEPEPDHTCDGGWHHRDSDCPMPCLVCKPHLDPKARRRRLGLRGEP